MRFANAREKSFYKTISYLLVVVFALSVTAVAISVSDSKEVATDDEIVLASRGNGNGNANGSSNGNANGNANGNGNGSAGDKEDRQRGNDRPALPECGCDCSTCQAGEHCSDCQRATPSPRPGGSDNEPTGGQQERSSSGEDADYDEQANDDAADSPSLAAAQQTPEPDEESSEMSRGNAYGSGNTWTPVPASGRGVTPTLITHTNPVCPVGTSSFKIDATPRNGTYEVPGGGTITISNATDFGFDFATSGLKVLRTMVKASDDAHIYDYTSLGGVTSDTGLWSVARPGGGFYQISHVTFCFERVEAYQIRGMKWEDVNGDGAWQSGIENLLPGWTIRLLKKTNGEYALYRETVTGSGGYYEFSELPAGEYRIEEVQQAGYVKTFGGCEFVLGGPTGGDLPGAACHDERPRCFDFGNMPLEDESFRKTFTLTTLELDATPLEIRYFATFLLDGAPTEIALSHSAPHAAELTGLPSGTEIANVQWWAELDGIRYRLGYGAAYEVIEETDLDNTFDYDGRVSGHKFSDDDTDGVWDDAEDGLFGWVIELFMRTDAGWSKVAQTTTDEDGRYEFEGLLPGDYYVVEVQQSGYRQTAGSTGPDFMFTIGPGGAVAFALPYEEDPLELGNAPDFVKIWELALLSDHESPAGVRYFVSFDLNGEARRAELSLLPGTAYPLIYSAESDVAFGDEISEVAWWANWRGENILLGEGFLSGDEMLYSETVEGNLKNVFRFEPIVFGNKFSDDDADGAWDDGEDGLPGWEIVLVRVMADGSEEEYGRVTTGPDGYYEFQAVLPGDYYLYEVEKDGWVQTAGPDALVSVENFQEIGPVDFGNARLGRIFGFKYADLAPNGVLGDEDFPLEGWTIQLYSEEDGEWSFLGSTRTDSDGYFSFEDLVPGDYYVVEVQQSGWIQTAGPIGPGDAVTLRPGGQIGPVEFLNAPPELPLSPRIFGHKYFDRNGDGNLDSGEGGLSGWTIELYFDNGREWELVATTLTDASGAWEFRSLPDGSALPNGDYYVVEVIPEGSRWRQTFGPRGPEDSFSIDDAVEVDYGPFDFGNAGGLPYLPFTGSSPTPLAMFALAAFAVGILLRRLGGAGSGVGDG